MTNQELNNWIAENIMEWHIVGYGDKNMGCGFHEYTKYAWYDNGAFKVPIHKWHPTESDSDAFRIVDKMNEKGFALQLFCTMGADSHLVDNWTAAFFKPFKPGFESIAKVRPLAICLAAQKLYQSTK